ncbi:MAG TPA: carboxypeptidase-like regulatory domain-containing protein, partial [Terriglobales bacterium]
MNCLKRYWSVALTLMSIAILVSAVSLAQENTGTISGFVHDPSGAAVTNATVTLKNVDRNQVVSTVQTNSDGFFTAPKLPLGKYTVEAEAQGFKKASLQQLTVNANDKLAANFTLAVGSTTETVEVT